MSDTAKAGRWIVGNHRSLFLVIDGQALIAYVTREADAKHICDLHNAEVAMMEHGWSVQRWNDRRYTVVDTYGDCPHELMGMPGAASCSTPSAAVLAAERCLGENK